MMEENKTVVVKGRSVGVTTMDDPTATPEVDEAVKHAAEQAEEKFNSLKWLTDQVEQDIADERKARRLKRNRRKSNRNNPVKATAAPTHRHRSHRIKRNDPCPCGAKNDDGKPIKYKYCCAK
jgi:uncharacterized protein YecA (UPF0149 family)